MVDTISEFQDELKSIRAEMQIRGSYADTKLVASWLDRLVVAIEKVAPTLDLIAEELDVVAENEECTCECCMGGGMGAKKPVAKKAAKPKKAKRRK